MMGLTSAQAKTLGFVQQFIAQNGFSPSFEEVGEGVGLASKSGVSRVLHCLKERGRITWDYGAARSLRLIGGYDDLDAKSDDELRIIRDRCNLILRGRAA